VGVAPNTRNKKQFNNDSLQRLFPPPKDPHFYSRYSGPWFPQTAGPFLFYKGIFFASLILGKHQADVSLKNQRLNPHDLAFSLNAVVPRPRIQTRRLRAGSTQGIRIAKEGDMRNFNWNTVIGALMLVRLGQELGTESQIARAIHDLVNAVLVVWR